MKCDIDSEIGEAENTADDKKNVATDSWISFHDNDDTEDACIQPDWISYGYAYIVSYIFPSLDECFICFLLKFGLLNYNWILTI